MPSRVTSAFAALTSRRQRGVYALEWAIIFPVFFMLLYGIICYGLTYLVRESMQFAVEEGARAALRYPVGKSAPNWNDRQATALASIQERLNWLPTAMRPTDATVQFTVCRISNVSDGSCDQDSSLVANLICDTATPCLVLVSFSIDNYPDNAIAPALPGFGLILPQSLRANASILVDRRVS
ncbi:MAG: TadE/TadG family type IV pilus assembly protein [Ottowia sp.]|uniref:TadE/TadG family type IV pilus assembly protein n=1 Tax=Ottowia sp. TaxID=1898956 RepID=UPI003C70A55B